MITLRCTQRFLKRLRTKPAALVDVAGNALGHWYANVMTINNSLFVHAISERSLLSVVLPGAPFNTLAARFPRALAEVLDALAVPQSDIARELTAMSPLAIAATAN